MTCALFVIDANAILVVNEPWVRLLGNGNAELYLRLTSTEGAKLVRVSSFAARKVILRGPGPGKPLVVELALPAQKEIVFAPDGFRAELRGLTRPLSLGQYAPVTLTVESSDGSRQDILINAEVRRHSPRDDEGHGAPSHR